jgi:hypothetical protein
MAKLVFENKDLVTLIYTFDTEHRKKMKEVCYSICYRYKTRNSKYFGKDLLSPVPNATKHCVNGYVFLWFFVRKRCHCCSRHCYRKPNIRLEEGWIVYEDGDKSWVPEAKMLDECYCDCRHACRKMKRYLASQLHLV